MCVDPCDIPGDRSDRQCVFLENWQRLGMDALACLSKIQQATKMLNIISNHQRSLTAEGSVELRRKEITVFSTLRE